MPYFLEEILALITGRSNPELVRKRGIRKLKKTLGSNRYKRFYQPKNRELAPAAATFFYDIYRAVSAAQMNWIGVSASPSFKNLVVEHFVPPDVLEKLNGLAAEQLAKRIRLDNIREVTRKAREDFQAFARAISRETAEAVDSCCYYAQVFEQFAAFDYYFLLKKFGTSLREYMVSENPVFTWAKGALVSGELKDYLYVSIPLDPKQDWALIFRLFTNANGIDAVRTEHWYSVLTEVQDVNSSRILEYIIRHIDANPDWTPTSFQGREPIMNLWLDARRKELDATLEQLVRDQRSAQVGELSRQLFGEEPDPLLGYYTPLAGEFFTGKGFVGFVHAEGLNYLAVFIAIFEREIRELCELLVIRAVYASISRPQPLTDQSAILTDLAQQISLFDESLQNDGKWGYRLYQAIIRSGQDRMMFRSIQDTLHLINEEAQIFLVTGSQTFAVIQDAIIAARRDYESEQPQLVLNWQGLELAASRPLGEWLAVSAEKLTLFGGMMSLFVEDAGVPAGTLTSITE